MITVISGEMRSGTTMMMKRAEREGIKVFYSNPFYELPDIDFDNIKKYDGGVIKVLAGGILRLPKFKYNVIFMHRDIDDLLRSKEKLTGQSFDKGVTQGIIDKALNGIKARDDMELIELDFNHEVQHDNN